jgi:hypothetical protein
MGIFKKLKINEKKEYSVDEIREIGDYLKDGPRDFIVVDFSFTSSRISDKLFCRLELLDFVNETTHYQTGVVGEDNVIDNTKRQTQQFHRFLDAYNVPEMGGRLLDRLEWLKGKKVTLLVKTIVYEDHTFQAITWSKNVKSNKGEGRGDDGLV